MNIEDFLPRNIIKTFIVLIVFGAFSLILHHFFGAKYLEWRYSNEPNTESANEIQQEEKATQQSPEINNASRDNSFRVDTTEALSPAIYKKLDSTKIAQLEYDQQLWKEARGYFTADDYNQYASYDDQTLWELGNQGDLKALHMLADSFKESGRVEDTNQILGFASIHGSTKALTRLATISQVQSWRTEANEKDKINNIKNMLAFAEAAAMRGDLSGIWAGLMELQNNAINLSVDDISDASAIARQIYDDLQNRRSALGLDLFDNSSDPLTDFQMDYMISALPNPNGWATSYINSAVEPVFSSDIAKNPQ